MIRVLDRHVAPIFLAACLVTPAIACSSSEDADSTSGAPDGGAPDVANGDASSDSPDANTNADAGSDAGARMCSGDNFCHTALPPKSFVRDVWSAGDGVVWAVAWNDPLLTLAESTILRWDGTSWVAQFKDDARLNAVWGSSATDLWVGGDSGLFHGTGPSSDAITWTKVRSGPITSIWGSSASDVWAVGSTKTHRYEFDGKVLHYRGPGTDGSDGWEIDPISSRPAAYRKIWGTSASDVWLSGLVDGGCNTDCYYGAHAFAYRRRTDGSWSESLMPDLGGAGQGSIVSGAGSITTANVWLAGNRSTQGGGPSYDILVIGTAKADGSGFDWTESTFGTCRGWNPCDDLWYSRAVWGKAPNDVYLAGDFGMLRHWDGTQFSMVKTTIEKIPMTKALYAMWGSSSTDLWVVGDEVALHKVAPEKP